MNWWNLLDWACIAANLFGIGMSIEASRTWKKRIADAENRLKVATWAQATAIVKLGAVLAGQDSNRLGLVLVRLFEDDAVADRTKGALARHLDEMGVDLAALGVECYEREHGNA